MLEIPMRPGEALLAILLESTPRLDEGIDSGELRAVPISR
jgi:hypothetical protein